jgi:hypothetical protein
MNAANATTITVNRRLSGRPSLICPEVDATNAPLVNLMRNGRKAPTPSPSALSLTALPSPSGPAPRWLRW